MTRRLVALAASVALAGVAVSALAQDDPIGDLLNRRAAGPVAPPAAPAPVPQSAPEAPPPPPASVPETVSSPAVLPPEPKKPEASPVAKAPATPPGKRPRYSVAIIQAVDKITAESMRFEAPVGQSVRYKNLIFTVRSCEASASDEVERDAIAHIEVDFQPVAPAGRPAASSKSVYRGWMFAASPSLSPLEHPVYDAWLIACKAA